MLHCISRLNFFEIFSKNSSPIDQVVHHVRNSISGAVGVLTSPLHHHSRDTSIHNEPVMDLPTLKNVARQALRGLALLHRQHRMHRDIKPGKYQKTKEREQVHRIYKKAL